MRSKHKKSKASAERMVKDIRRATRKQYSAEDKIRIVLESLRGDVHFVKNWGALVEGRLLTNDILGSERVGFLAAVYRHIGNNAKIGIGYSFTDFSDDLADQSYTSKGIFVNLLGKF